MASPLPQHPPFPPAPEPEPTASSVAPDGARHCLNCGAALDTPFCPQCGQRDIDASLSVRDFAHELVAEHFGLDSKVARTLVALVRRPGRLTTEFIEGRRVRYVPPLRLYLSLSVLYFLLSAFTGRFETHEGKGFIEMGSGTVRVDTTGGAAVRTMDSVHAAIAANAKQRDARGRTKGNFLKDTLHSGAMARWIKRRANHRIEELRTNGKTATAAIGTEFQREMPDAVFLLVPMLALMLGVVYFGQRRYYAEHLVFALHFQAFVFAALIIALLPIPFLDVAIWVAGTIYAYQALRTVYGGGRGTTVLKLGVLGFGYAISAGIVMSLLALFVFFFG